ncbi:MAG: serine hydrolase, partial [Elusimicrobia bacterium]|nr:serine hydrolase [Elusimicrobiota bacterium]
WEPVMVPRAPERRIARRRRALPSRAKLADAAKPVAARIQQEPSSLSTEIDSYIERLRRIGAIKGNESTAWSVYDLTSNASLVSINEDEPMETASLIKPLIALAYFKEVSDGRLRYTPYVRRRMAAMIQDSDNAAADYFLRKMGGPAAVQRLLKKNYGGLLQNLHLVEYIPYSGRTYRNKASAHDYSRFLYALWNKQLPSSDELLRLMSLPKPNRLFTAELPPSTEVFDKTGTTSRLCGDMGILVIRHEGQQYPYIVVGIIQKSRRAYPYMRWMNRRGNIIRQVSNFVYEAIAGRHGFGQVLSANAVVPARPALE